MEFVRRNIGFVIRVLVSAAILIYLARKINFAETWEIAREMDPALLVAAFLCFAPMLALTAWRWQILLDVQRIHLTFSQVFQLNLVGHFFNAFLLGSTGGDVVKIFYATRAAPKQRSAAGLSVIIDRLLGMVVLLGIALVFCFWMWRFLTSSPEGDTMDVAIFGWHLILTPALAVYLTIGIGAAAAAFIGASLGLPPIKAWAKRHGMWERLPLHGTLERIFDAYQRYSTAYAALAVSTLISIVNHALNIILAWLILRAMNLEAPFWEFASIMPIILLLIAVPITVSGFGVREGLCILFFTLFGFSQEHAIAFSLTLWLVYTLWSVIGGIVYLRYETPPALSAEEIQA